MNLKKNLSLIVFLGIFLFFLPRSVLAARLYFVPADITVTSGEQFSVDVYLDTENKTVNQADLSLIYPQNLIWIDSVDFSGPFPLISQDIKKSQGRAYLRFSSDSHLTRVNGNYFLARINLSTHESGEAYLSFFCDGTNNVSDSNVWEADTSRDILDCNRLGKISIHIAQKVVFQPESCTIPSAPANLRVVSGPTEGQVILYWNDTDNIDYYSLVYGLTSKGYIYGATNIGKTSQYTVSGMDPGRIYYFALLGVNSCGSSGHSLEVFAPAGGNIAVVQSNGRSTGNWQPSPQPITNTQPSPISITKPSASPVLVSFKPEPYVSQPDFDEESPQATFSASIQPSYSPEPFIPPKQEPFWRSWEFWKKVGILSAILFVLMLVFSGLIRGSKKRKKSILDEANYEDADLGLEPKTPEQPLKSVGKDNENISGFAGNQDSKAKWQWPSIGGTKPEEGQNTPAEKDFRPFSSRSIEDDSRKTIDKQEQ